MSDIFISYASADKERIQPIVQTLERKGWSVWWDRKIPPGKTFDEAIEDAIDAAKCVIVVWTKKSVASRWVRTEAGEGERRGVLIPLLLDDVKIPLAFKRIEAAQLTDWDGVSGHPELDGLLEAITRCVEKPPITEPNRHATEKAGIERRETKKARHERQEADKRTPNLKVAVVIWYVSIACLILGILTLILSFILDPQDHEARIPVILITILGIAGLITTRKKR